MPLSDKTSRRGILGLVLGGAGLFAAGAIGHALVDDDRGPNDGNPDRRAGGPDGGPGKGGRRDGDGRRGRQDRPSAQPSR